MPPPLRVLVADDDPVCLALLKTLLNEWGYAPEVHADGMEAWLALEGENPPPLAILDWSMPGMDGPEICQKLRESHREPYVYAILLTGQGGVEHLIEGLGSGADDYVAKPFRIPELRARLDVGRRLVELQADLVAARETLLLKATTDSLTGVWNRQGILDILSNELARGKRAPAPLTVILADMDRFKAINDVHGHAAGDAALIEASHRLKASLRSYDAIGRYGGEEFLLLMPGCPVAAAPARAEALRSALASSPLKLQGGAQIRLSASFGLVALAPGQTAGADAIIKAADEALYRAKAAGRDRVESAPLD